ncbi:MAG: hypothetical protein L0Z68_04200 [Gammaproteobacteria bacterium]|nr:hypothetical protein [Gammaproteobacteria bacterium]
MADTNAQSGGDALYARRSIAIWVIGASAGGLIALAIAMIAAAQSGQAGDAAEKAFTMLVPLLGSWVGTVLAYYFSGENFERASQSVSKLVEQVTEERLRNINVKDAMIKKNAMTFVQLQAGDDGSKVNLKTDIIDRLKDPVTRMPVLDDKGVAKYIIHQSLIFKYVTMKTIELAATNQSFAVHNQTLKDFFGYGEMLDLVSKTFAFVSVNGTLADAKKAMDSVRGCQDIFVTDHGTEKEPINGWLTNVDITKHARL